MQEITTILREVIQKRQRRRERAIVTSKKQKEHFLTGEKQERLWLGRWLNLAETLFSG